MANFFRNIIGEGARQLVDGYLVLAAGYNSHEIACNRIVNMFSFADDHNLSVEARKNSLSATSRLKMEVEELCKAKEVRIAKIDFSCMEKIKMEMQNILESGQDKFACDEQIKILAKKIIEEFAITKSDII